jgi:hypothetical protein
VPSGGCIRLRWRGGRRHTATEREVADRQQPDQCDRQPGRRAALGLRLNRCGSGRARACRLCPGRRGSGPVELGRQPLDGFGLGERKVRSQLLGLAQRAAGAVELALRGKQLGLHEMRLGAVGVVFQHLGDHRVGIGHPAAVRRVVDLLDGGVARWGRAGLRQCKRWHAECHDKGEGEGGEQSLKHEDFPVRSCREGRYGITLGAQYWPDLTGRSYPGKTS